MNNQAAVSEVIPTLPGTPFGGGQYCHRLFDGTDYYVLIVSTREGDFSELPHKEALEKIAALDIGGKKDWKLPTRPEALAMFEELSGKVKDTDDAFDRDWYWTSQQYESDSSYAWFQSFYCGNQYYFHESSQLRVRAVRREKI